MAVFPGPVFALWKIELTPVFTAVPDPFPGPPVFTDTGFHLWKIELTPVFTDTGFHRGS
jgi:hypothetical protein